MNETTTRRGLFGWLLGLLAALGLKGAEEAQAAPRSKGAVDPAKTKILVIGGATLPRTLLGTVTGEPQYRMSRNQHPYGKSCDRHAWVSHPPEWIRDNLYPRSGPYTPVTFTAKVGTIDELVEEYRRDLIKAANSMFPADSYEDLLEYKKEDLDRLQKFGPGVRTWQVLGPDETTPDFLALEQSGRRYMAQWLQKNGCGCHFPTSPALEHREECPCRIGFYGAPSFWEPGKPGDRRRSEEGVLYEYGRTWQRVLEEKA